MVTVGIYPFKEISHDRAGNRTRDLMISSQRLWPLDHEAGRIEQYSNYEFSDRYFWNENILFVPFLWDEVHK